LINSKIPVVIVYDESTKEEYFEEIKNVQRGVFKFDEILSLVANILLKRNPKAVII